MICCKNSWKMWLYILAIISLIVGLFVRTNGMAMIILAVLLAIAAYLIKDTSSVAMPKAKEVAKSKVKKKK